MHVRMYALCVTTVCMYVCMPYILMCPPQYACMYVCLCVPQSTHVRMPYVSLMWPDMPYVSLMWPDMSSPPPQKKKVPMAGGSRDITIECVLLL